MYGSSNRYYFQNNIWNPQGSSQCIEPYTFGDYAGFRVASANHVVQDDAPAGYPSVVKGWHWGFKTVTAQPERWTRTQPERWALLARQGAAEDGDAHRLCARGHAGGGHRRGRGELAGQSMASSSLATDAITPRSI